MKIKPAIRTEEEIDKLANGVAGTWVRRRNARNRMIDWSNGLVDKQIEELKTEIRQLKAKGYKAGDLRSHYAEITKLELKLI